MASTNKQVYHYGALHERAHSLRSSISDILYHIFFQKERSDRSHFMSLHTKVIEYDTFVLVPKVFRVL